ncbi:copper resistance D family protein [Cellulomonas aerilata]|uniref:Copper resistance protein D domain-containing protein n=1 Tax=Cellulomonas aerilata TaxID=515326 RepID=A0A512DBM4_9CELL|nr:CopD family protein [Cellulomonas aerilata]GEO33881.1 hypothetical protein CAE01nite_16060 [Cellulomonas aerilata]
MSQVIMQRRSGREAGLAGAAGLVRKADEVRPGASGTGAPTAGRAHAAGQTVVLGALAALAVLVAAALVGGAATPTALADPGPLTRWGVLIARAAYDLAAIGTLGVLLVSVVLLPRSDGGYGSDGARLVRAVSWWAGAWSVTALVTTLLTLSKVAALPVPAVLAPDVLPLVLDLEQTRSLLASAWLAALVAIGARVTRSPAGGVLLLLTALGALVLPLLNGHAGHGDSPVVTATSLALHVAGAAAWVGGLAALVVYLRRSGTSLAVTLPRYSRVALVCFVVVGASGLVTGWAYLSTIDQLWTSAYGQLLLGKTVALAALGVFGHRHRSRTITAAASGRPRAFVRLAAAELILMACAAALAAALSQTAPPADLTHSASASPSTVVTQTVR